MLASLYTDEEPRNPFAPQVEFCSVTISARVGRIFPPRRAEYFIAVRFGDGKEQHFRKSAQTRVIRYHETQFLAEDARESLRSHGGWLPVQTDDDVLHFMRPICPGQAPSDPPVRIRDTKPMS